MLQRSGENVDSCFISCFDIMCFEGSLNLYLRYDKFSACNVQFELSETDDIICWDTLCKVG